MRRPAMLTLTLNDGRVVTADLIGAAPTYRDLTEDIPSEPTNEQILASILSFTQRNFPRERAVVIPPRITMRTEGARMWPELPPVMLVARFTSDKPVVRLAAKGSGLVVGWFQDALEPLVSPEVRPLIEAVDWARKGRDFF